MFLALSGADSEVDMILWFKSATICAYSSLSGFASGFNKFVVDKIELMDSSRSVPSNFDICTPALIKASMLEFATIPARANASKPCVISPIANPNSLDKAIAFAPISLPIKFLPLIASTEAVACWNSIADCVAWAKAAVAAIPKPIASVSVLVRYSDVLNARLPKRF